MWDPISIFAVCWALNSGLPPARLSVDEVLRNRETVVIVESITKDIKLREGL